jgi:hypothetical protein
MFSHYSLLLQRIPLPALGALALPPRGFVLTIGANENSLRFGHRRKKSKLQMTNVKQNPNIQFKIY